MRPFRIIALADAAAIGMATALFVGPSLLGVTYVAVTVIVMWASGAYRPRIYYRLPTQLPTLLYQMTASTLIVSAWPNTHRLTFLVHLPLTLGVIVVARLATYGVVRAIRSQPGRCDNALIIGADERGSMVAGALLRTNGCGITPIGFVDDGATRPHSPLPVLADLAHLDQVIERLDVRHVIVAGSADSEATVSTRPWHCQVRAVQVWSLPPLFELGADPCGRGTDDLWAIPFRHVRRRGRYSAAWPVKRAFDVAVAATMLALTAPILVVVALAVRLTSQGPIFFRQKRIGHNGREFELLKFRTMAVNDDSDTIWSVHDDRRMTPVGRFLRRSCIDELPQVFNVIRGDMSLVGPRPERPFFDVRFRATVPNYADRLRVPVGITGWAQIHGLRGDTSIAERTRFDNFYIEHWSLWLDVVIMVRTLTALVQWACLTDAAPAGGVGLEALPEPVMIGQAPVPGPMPGTAPGPMPGPMPGPVPGPMPGPVPGPVQLSAATNPR